MRAFDNEDALATGAFELKEQWLNCAVEAGEGIGAHGFVFAASKSNSVFGKSQAVQMESLRLLAIIKA